MAGRQLEFFARCAAGFEAVLADELRGLGVTRVRPLKGGVSFFGTLENGYRVCLWSRVATRVELVVMRIGASDAEELYAGVREIAGERRVRSGATVAVRAHGTNPALRNTQFTALKVKDALCDRLREARGSRPDVDGKNPDFQLEVALHERRATVSLNFSGPSLHRRGYREPGVQSEAPLKETLAAGMLMAAGWTRLADEGGMLVDPMCGSGTLAIEGAMMAAGIAPGLLRERWGFTAWLEHREDLWEAALAEAKALAEGSWTPARIVAGDVDAHAVELARANARRAGVEQFVRFHVDDAARLGKHVRRGQALPTCGLLAANPPYGERLLSRDELPAVYASLAQAVNDVPRGWDVAIITPDAGIDQALGRTPEQVIACKNGPIPAWVRLYQTDVPPLMHQLVSLGGRQLSVPLAEQGSTQFAARLRKEGKRLIRRARREGMGCFRVYDADLPDYVVRVDVLEGAGPQEGERFLRVDEPRRSHAADAQRASRRFADAVALSCAVLDVHRANAVAQEWLDDARASVRRDAQRTPRFVTVEEDGVLVSTDLSGTPGMCLVPEQRELRRAVTERCDGGRFANLFAGGGAATAWAAKGGARGSVTVDASKERLAWVRGVLELNGLAGPSHRMVQADVRSWLVAEARAHHSYDLVVCVPPAYLAARGKGGDWDYARDCSELLRLVAAVLSRNGELLFMPPLGSGELEASLLAAVGLRCEKLGQQLWSLTRSAASVG